MLGLVGIMGCVVMIVAAGVGVLVGVAGLKMSYDAKVEAAENAEVMKVQQQQAEQKAENRSKAMKLAQDRQANSSLLKSQQLTGGSIMLNEVRADRAQLKANRTRMENGLDHKGYEKGKPL
ncbi:MAG: hypothetical protein WC956_03140 [bacterium]